ncbi:hypothetical protein [Streptomyces sp. KL116D]|uniref:hypothetical protein n=1 Tax=Streptomyces sp. KL116D TaxID=3045152 RepID=UPI0035578A53
MIAAGADASLQGGAHKVGAHSAFDVGARAQPEHVQGDDLGGVGEGRCVPGWGAGDGRPDGAKDLAARADGDSDPGHVHLEALGAGVDVDRVRVAVEPFEDSGAFQAAGELLGHLASEDRSHPGLVRLVLPAGEGEYARGPVLDGHRRVDKRGHRVGDGEQVSSRQSVEGLLLCLADVVLGKERAQHGGKLVPRGPGGQCEQADTRLLHRVYDVGCGLGRLPDHQRGRVPSAVVVQQLDDVVRISHAHAEDHGMGGGTRKCPEGRG